jgi:hypothetical protein
MKRLTSLRLNSTLRLPTMLVAIAVLATTAKPARALIVNTLWDKVAGDASSQFCYDVAIDDATGRVAIGGAFAGTQNFGGANMTSAGQNDGFVVVFEADGTFLAQRHFGDTNQQYAFALDWSDDGYLYVTGYFAGSINLGGSTLTSVGNTDIFLGRFDYLLTHISSTKFGDASAQYAFDLVVDDSDNVIITGYFQGGVNFGGALLTSAGANDIYVAKFNSALVAQWSARYGDAAGSQFGQGVDADAAGNVYLCGYFGGTVNFGGSNLTSAGGNDVYAAKLNSAGAHQWSKRFGDASNQVATKISADAAGNNYLTGYFAGTINFGGAALTTVGADDIFLAKFSATGTLQWSQRYGDASSQFGMSVTCTDAAVFIGGQSAGTTNFGGSNLVSPGGRDMYLAKLTVAGVHEWSRIFGDSGEQYGYSVDTALGRVALAGYFQGSIILRSAATSAGGNDVALLVASTSSYEPVIKSVRDVPNDQGRFVRVRFERAGYDDGVSPEPISAYEAFVEEPLLTAAALPGLSPQGGGVFIYVGSIPAHAQTHYSMIVPTFADSTIADGDYNSRVYIRAVRSSDLTVISSSVATGSSVDNLAPGMQDLRFDNGLLHWNPADGPDVDYYSVYGGATASFGSATLLDYTIENQIDMSASPRAYYFVTATDFSGNESAPRMLRRLTGAPETPAAYVLSISAYPNPFNPSTRVRYTLPARGHVAIDVYDARGGHVTRLVNEAQDEGAHAVAWDGTDSRGAHAGSGVYFARVTHTAGSRSYKLVLVK